MEEGLIDLIFGANKLTRSADLTTLGWKTSALILWIRETSIPSLTSSFCFSQDMIHCGNCPNNLGDEFFEDCYTCSEPLGKNAINASVSLLSPGTIDPLVKLEDIRCNACGGRCFGVNHGLNIRCRSCAKNTSVGNVRISLKKGLDEKIEEIFGEEIKDLLY
jgi:hypothetical protein